MEPLTITVGAVSLTGTITKAIFTINTFVRAVRDAPSDRDAVKSELVTLKTALDGLTDDFESADPTSGDEPIPKVVQTHIVKIIGSCYDVVHAIEDLLQEHSGNGVKMKAKWALSGSDDMAKLRSNLEARKSALELALDVVVLAITKDIRRDTGDIKQDTRDIKDTTENIKRDITELKSDAGALHEHSTAIKTDTSRILEEILRLQTLLPDNVLQSFGDMSSYAESVLDASPRHSIDEPEHPKLKEDGTDEKRTTNGPSRSVQDSSPRHSANRNPKRLTDEDTKSHLRSDSVWATDREKETSRQSRRMLTHELSLGQNGSSFPRSDTSGGAAASTTRTTLQKPEKQSQLSSIHQQGPVPSESSTLQSSSHISADPTTSAIRKACEGLDIENKKEPDSHSELVSLFNDLNCVTLNGKELNIDIHQNKLGPQPGDVQISLEGLKRYDRAHTEEVIRLYSQSQDPTERRVLHILQQMLDSDISPSLSVSPIGNNIRHLRGTILGPSDSPYAGGIFHVEIVLPVGYPFMEPLGQTLTGVPFPRYHGFFKKDWPHLWDPSAYPWARYHMYLDRILSSFHKMLARAKQERPWLEPRASEFHPNALHPTGFFYTSEQRVREMTNKFAQPAQKLSLPLVDALENATSLAAKLEECKKLKPGPAADQMVALSSARLGAFLVKEGTTLKLDEATKLLRGALKIFRERGQFQMGERPFRWRCRKEDDNPGLLFAMSSLTHALCLKGELSEGAALGKEYLEQLALTYRLHPSFVEFEIGEMEKLFAVTGPGTNPPVVDLENLKKELEKKWEEWERCYESA
ncbi:uncharacterized protein BDR25DRAFT_346390 [Lindgomyces ingoldianus]|uniref:Uncharacterized protein n=1 Tax=Lindgomyces ingoldianus TaxID=673940 RepID=A0ACB6QDP8_9PLEO|nr:uncharacterized protein BDR25DRAFT_346390 [Lindgomyces ingoldianus]KAF2465109.1 hypothetical protein BDR25DRAFT_346390 [Lindgomyces ingoldianus]